MSIQIVLPFVVMEVLWGSVALYLMLVQTFWVLRLMFGVVALIAFGFAGWIAWDAAESV